MKKNKLKYLMFTVLTFFSGNIMVFAIESQNEYLKCGNNYIPAPIAPITRVIVLLLQLVLPIVLIVMGSLDLLKAVSSSNQDNIKKSQSKFFKRLVSGVIFFFVFTLVKFIVGIAADANENKNIMKCVSCLIDDKEKCGEISKVNPFVSD